MNKIGRVLWALLLILGVACRETAAENPTPLPSLPPANLSGDPAQGETLYNQRVLGRSGAPGCVTCHSLAENVNLVGPSHYGLADRVAQEAPDQTAVTYLWQSIVEPDAHITTGFAAGVMYRKYATELTAQQVADLVAYMLTLRSSTP